METGVSAGFTDFYRQMMHLEKADARQYSPLVLAYVGDAVYEIMVRTKMVSAGNLPVNKLHKNSSHLACAGTQAKIIKALEDELTEEEHAVFKRGRNAKSMSSAKNASIVDYRLATGFEALVGWLFLSEQFERMTVLVSRGFAALEEEEAREAAVQDKEEKEARESAAPGKEEKEARESIIQEKETP